MNHFFVVLLGVELKRTSIEGLPLTFSHPMTTYKEFSFSKIISKLYETKGKAFKKGVTNELQHKYHSYGLINKLHHDRPFSDDKNVCLKHLCSNKKEVVFITKNIPLFKHCTKPAWVELCWPCSNQQAADLASPICLSYHSDYNYTMEKETPISSQVKQG